MNWSEWVKTIFTKLHVCHKNQVVWLLKK